MQSNIMDSIVSQMCRQFKEYKSMMESTVLTLRQQADINTAAMVARGVDTTESTTTDSTTIPETFTETTKSGLEMSEETDMYKPLLNPNSALLFNVAWVWGGHNVPAPNKSHKNTEKPKKNHFLKAYNEL